ncbi:ABC transporter substrate-binding protein [Pusillimonas sp. NJUB218]|uniref:ABC transporter substrate-binding protein n=1 Tax=Pusillimonas sp. NJUB218 TaxID=2023230 RepID=UPI000F4BE71F|nr:ABC transporter substrate-binding protein [Pusillimonas sp. NJUB218]ROT46199.1 aliphatic sulfonate ABC transporter substrate-binding protein [Pusillimonas sp. NJUB218]
MTKIDNQLRSRRTFLQMALAAGASLAVPGLSIGQAKETTLRIGYIGPSPELVNVSGWALTKGHLLREIEPLGYRSVTTHTFANGPDLNEAFLAGSVDVGIYGDTPSLVARSRGLKNKLIGFDQIGMDVWLLTPQGGVTSIKALEGQVVAVALGSYMHRYVIGLLKGAGILKSTKIVYMLPRDGGPALEKKAVAAFAAPIGMGPLLAARGFPVLDQASRHPDLTGSSLITASDEALNRVPELAAALLRARQSALDEIRKNPDAYYAFHAKASGFTEEVVRASHPISQFAYDAYPAIGLEGLKDVNQFLLNEKLIRQPVDLNQWRLAGL